jgi:DNA-binding transcriptional ArsR family regulator
MSVRRLDVATRIRALERSDRLFAATRIKELQRSAHLFAALGDPTRLRLVARLCEGGPQSIASLTDRSAVTRQAVTKHLRVLKGAGLVRDSRLGRESRWAVESEQLEVARRYLAAISERWNERLEALRRHVENTPDE